MKKSLEARTLLFPAPVWIIGTYDPEGKPNIMTAAWGGICCSKPPCVAVSLRKATYTYSNIMEKRAFTVNVASEEHAQGADFAGMASGRDVDKFKKTGWTPVRSELVDAPYIDQMPLIAECRMLHALEIGLHTQFIGQILDIKAQESVIGESGLAEMEKVRPLVFGPEVRTYHGLGAMLGTAFSLGRDLMED